MKLLDKNVLTSSLANGFGGGSDLKLPFLTWVDATLVTALLQNAHFVKEFVAKVEARRVSLFQDSGSPNGKVSFYYSDLSGTKVRVYLTDSYAESDANRGLLGVYQPRTSLFRFLQDVFPTALEARDFFDSLLEKKPTTDLRKYTLDTLPASLATWKAQQAVLRRAKLRQQALEHAQQVLDQTNTVNVSDIHKSNLSLEEAETKIASLLKSRWMTMVEGVDYVKVAQVESQTLIRLLSPKSLDWEADYKGSCIDGKRYKDMLSSSTSLLLSTRDSSDLSLAKYTAEASLTRQGWELVQFEGWGYRATYLKQQVVSDYEFLKTRGSVENVLKDSHKFPVLDIRNPNSLEFNLTQRGD